jgi:hypothetical protein
VKLFPLLLVALSLQTVTLDSLEAKQKALPGERTPEGMKARLDLNQDVFKLVETNALKSGDEFRRAGNLVIDFFFDFDNTRVRYELALAAAAKGDEQSRKDLALRWDLLQASLGRPLRLGALKVPGANEPDSQFRSDPAPKCVVTVMLDPIAAKKAAEGVKPNTELKALVDADQAAREDWSKLTPEQLAKLGEEDKKRWARVVEIVKSSDLLTSADYGAAALVLQHGHNYASYCLAHELAVCSVLTGDASPWLCAATYDRMLHSAGQHQRFATQYGPTGLQRVDTEGICDNERAALRCPTLEQARTRVLK